MSNKFELPKSENYETIVGYSEIFKRDVYRIVNRHTGVIEFENPMYGTVLAVFRAIGEAEGDDDDEVAVDADALRELGLDLDDMEPEGSYH